MPISVPLGVARRLAPCDRPAPRRKQPRRGSRTRSPRPPVGRRVVAPACSEPEWRLRWPLRPHRPRPPFSGNHAGRSPDPSCLPPCLRLDLMVPEVVSCLGQNAPFPVAAARLFDAGTASTHLESCNSLPTTKRLYSRSDDGSPAWCIIAAVAAPAAVIRMPAPRRGVVRTSVAPVLPGRSFCDFEFMQALLLNFRHEGKRAIEKVARNQPAAYLKILALLVPREMQIEHTNRIKQMTDEEIEQAIEAIQTMLAARAGEAAKVIEGTAEPAALPAPNGPSPEAAPEA